MSESQSAVAAPPGTAASLTTIPYEQMIREVAQLQLATQHIPGIVAQEIRKNWPELAKGNAPGANGQSASRAPKTWMLDPFDVMYSLGWKERRASITFDMIKEVEKNLAILRSIINTRSAQVVQFSEPYDDTQSLGFTIVHKDRSRQMTKAERQRAVEIEGTLLNCGSLKKNPYTRARRSRLDEFMRKIVRDLILFDQVCIEMVPDRLGNLFEFWAADASTFRLALDDDYYQKHDRRGGALIAQEDWPKLDGLPYAPFADDGNPARYVQVVNQTPVNSYSDEQLIFAVMNPRTDIYVGEYGYSIVEQAVTIITALLDTEKYQTTLFRNGSLPRGFLNLKGTEWTPESLEGLKRQWNAQLQGVQNAHRIPVVSFDGDAQFINMQTSNRDMEWPRWQEFLVSVFCGVALIDPEEVSIPVHGGVSQTPLFEASSEWKLKASRDRGLKPMLRFLAGVMQRLVDRIDDHFSFRFLGLDEPSEKDKHDRRLGDMAFKTVNETRQLAGLPRYDSPVADWIMNPTVLSAERLYLDQKKAALEQQQLEMQVAQQRFQLLQVAQESMTPQQPATADPATNGSQTKQ